MNAFALSSRKKQKCQGDHGRCRANYRCCIPALAGFVSPHSVGPGKTRGEKLSWRTIRSKKNVEGMGESSKKNSEPLLIYARPEWGFIEPG